MQIVLNVYAINFAQIMVQIGTNNDEKRVIHFERNMQIYVVIKPEFSKFPKKIEVWSLSSSRCKLSVSVDFVS